MKLIELQQGSAEWHAHRASARNASEAPAMMGFSPYKTRTELLREKTTGVCADVDAATQKRFDRGHEIEAFARSLAEQYLEDDLYPIIATDDDGWLSASFDGLTMDNGTAWECKTANAALRAAMDAGDLPDSHWPQVEQQLLISGAGYCVFTISDGTEAGTQHLPYISRAERRAALIAAWRQFDADLSAYVPSDIKEMPKADVVVDLPALFVHAKGEITTHNMDEFGNALAIRLAETRAIVLVTDQDFSNAKDSAKKFRETAKAIALSKDAMLSQTETIGEAARKMDAWAKDLNATALQLEKDVEREDKAKKEVMVLGGKNAYTEHIAALEREIAPIRLNLTAPNFPEALKNKRNYASMQDAVDTMLAGAKMAADAAATDVRSKLTWCKEHAAGHSALFPDLQQIIGKPMDDFTLTISSRIATAKAAEEKRLEAEREKIRAEEEAKAAAKSKAAQDEEDALIASIWNNANRIEGDSVSYVEKAINRFDSGDDLSRDPRPRVAAAFNEARMQMQKKLIAAKAKAEQDEAERLAIEQRAAAPATNTTATASQSTGEQAGTTETPALGTRETVNGATLAQVLHAAAPAEIAQVMAPADTGATMKLGDISSLLGFTVTADFLAVLGFQPARTEKAARLYPQRDFPAICAAIARHVNAVAATATQKAA